MTTTDHPQKMLELACQLTQVGLERDRPDFLSVAENALKHNQAVGIEAASIRQKRGRNGFTPARIAAVAEQTVFRRPNRGKPP